MPLSRRRKTSAPVEVAGAEEPSTRKDYAWRKLFNPSILQDISEGYQDNPFILHGYRPVTNSACASFASWLYLHNETLNVFAHLLPGILFLIAESVIYQYLHVRYPHATKSDNFAFAVFLSRAVICLGVPNMYHTFTSHSAHVSDIWLRLDFVVIIVLNLGGFCIWDFHDFLQ